MRKAIIDLGTNTFNLLIADVEGSSFQVVHAEKDGVAIGMGGINQGVISEASEYRAIQTLRNFRSVCDMYEVEKIWCFGTSALRDAKNADLFTKKIKLELDLNVQIISGKEEAQLIYQGVHGLYDFHKPGVIIDIGGGSTEVIFASETGIDEMQSLNIGVSRIFQKFDFSDPFTSEDKKKIEQFLEQESNGFFENRDSPLMIGSSGSFETFYELIHQEYFPIENILQEVDLDDFKRILEEVIHSTLKERELNPFILPIRKIMAPITAVKTLWLMKKLKTTDLKISPYSLKEGALLKA